MLRRPKATVTTSNEASWKGRLRASATMVLAMPREEAWASISAQKSEAMTSQSGQASWISRARSPVPLATSNRRAGCHFLMRRVTRKRHQRSMPPLRTWLVRT